MADGGVQCSEMEEVELQASELWEDNHSRFENLFQEKRQYYKPNSSFFQVVSKIRGTYILIINYFHTFPEFGTSQEALNLTFNANDELNRLLTEYTDDQTYFTSLFESLKQIADQVHTACFITHNVNTEFKMRKKPASQAKKTKNNETNGPAKKQKTSSSNIPLKEEVVVSSVATNNKFDVLYGLPTAEETVTSYQKVTSEPSVSNLETNEPTENAVTERTIKKKEPRPPSITVLGHDNICQNNKAKNL